MATLSPLQPELRALMLFDTLPPGCVSFLCSNHSSMPHVRPGEFVVVDTNDREPVVGEIFVIKFGEETQHHHICTVRPSQLNPAKVCVGAITNDSVRRAFERLETAGAAGIERNRLMMAAYNAAGGWTEGPYGPAGSRSHQHLLNCLLGRVIGIYAPKFKGPLKVVGGAP